MTRKPICVHNASFATVQAALLFTLSVYERVSIETDAGRAYAFKALMKDLGEIRKSIAARAVPDEEVEEAAA